jgi:hypothetical protein
MFADRSDLRLIRSRRPPGIAGDLPPATRSAALTITEQMNQAVFAFRRYEDASLRYTGIESHEGLAHIGLYDTVVARKQKNGDSSIPPGITGWNTEKLIAKAD